MELFVGTLIFISLGFLAWAAHQNKQAEAQRQAFLARRPRTQNRAGEV